MSLYEAHARQTMGLLWKLKDEDPELYLLAKFVFSNSDTEADGLNLRRR